MAAGAAASPADAAASLIGCTVVEVGVRQAWPYLTFATSEADEVRLYIDSTFTVQPAPPDSGTGDEDDVRLWLLRLAELLNLTVDLATVTTGASLSMQFTGDITLKVAGQAAPWTAHEAWWLGRA